MRIHPAVAATVSLLIGLASGWLLRDSQKPAGSPDAAKSSPGQPVPKAVVINGDDGGEPPVFTTPPPRVRPGEHEEEDQAAAEEDAKNYADSLKAHLQSQVTAWKAALGLKPEQLAALEKAIEKAAAVPMPNPENPDSAITPPQEQLEADLAGILDPAQADRFAKWQERKQQVQSESKAAAGLAEIEAELLLDPAQREAVRKSLLEQAASDPVDPHPPTPGIDSRMIEEITTQLGEDMEDPAKFQAAAKQWIDARIQSDLDRMKSILTPAQLEAYKQSLDRKYSGWMGEGP